MNKVIFSFLILLSACSSQEQDPNLYELKDFNLQADALKEGELVEVIYATVGQIAENSQDHFYPCVVVSVETGDTVNVFMPIQTKITEDDLLRQFNSSSSSSFQIAVENLQSNGQISSLENMNKVAIPREDRYFVNSLRPTTFGLLARVVMRKNHE